MLVSVIVPNYNHSKYLVQRLDSVLSQTYQDIEVIILDDCSTDNSRDIINSYGSNSKITHIVFNEHNSGSTFNQWEKGFSLAKGDLIWIAESDDYCENTFLETMVPSFLNNKTLALAYCTSQIVNQEGQLCDYNDISEVIPEKIYDGSVFIKKYMLANNSIWNASAVLFRKKNVLYIDKIYKNFVAAGDHLFWIELAMTGDVLHFSRKMNCFRQHNNKVTPRKVLEGITYKEEYDILQYLMNNSFVNGIDELFIKSTFLLRIIKGSFNSIEIRHNLLTLWGHKWWMTPFILKAFIKILLLFRH